LFIELIGFIEFICLNQILLTLSTIQPNHLHQPPNMRVALLFPPSQHRTFVFSRLPTPEFRYFQSSSLSPAFFPPSHLRALVICFLSSVFCYLVAGDLGLEHWAYLAVD
jgi:hypothetical protein